MSAVVTDVASIVRRTSDLVTRAATEYMTTQTLMTMAPVDSSQWRLLNDALAHYALIVKEVGGGLGRENLSPKAQYVLDRL